MKSVRLTIAIIFQLFIFTSTIIANQDDPKIKTRFQTSEDATVKASIIDVYFMNIDGSNWHILPYPEPAIFGLDNYPIYWEYSFEGRNVELQFKSLGPPNIIEIWTGLPFDPSPHELQYAATAGAHTDKWVADLKNEPGNYATEEFFEIWMYRPGDDPRKLDDTSFTFQTDADPPITSVIPLPSTICISSSSKYITLNWGGIDVGPAGIWRYDVQYRVDTVDGAWTDIPDLMNTTKISGQFRVKAGLTYYFRCRGKDRFADPTLFAGYPQNFIDIMTAQHTESYPDGDGDTYIIVKPFPSATKQLQAVPNPGCVGKQYCVSWNSVSGATSYEISRDNSSWIDLGNSTLAYFRESISGDHKYSVRAKNQCGYGDASSELTVTINPVPDASATIPSVSPNAPDFGEKYTITWDPVAGASSYVIYENNVKIDSGSSTSMEFIKNSHGAFRYEIEACNDCGCGNRSNPCMVDIALGIKETDISELPSKFDIEQNHPNPFNPTTEIGFELPKACYALIEVFDITGRKIATPVNQNLSAGRYIARWDGSDMNGSPAPSGVYFYRLKADNYSATKKMILLK